MLKKAAAKNISFSDAFREAKKVISEDKEW